MGGQERQREDREEKYRRKKEWKRLKVGVEGLQCAHLKEFAHVRYGRNEARIVGTFRRGEKTEGEKINYAGGLLPVILGVWL